MNVVLVLLLAAPFDLAAGITVTFAVRDRRRPRTPDRDIRWSESGREVTLVTVPGCWHLARAQQQPADDGTHREDLGRPREDEYVTVRLRVPGDQRGRPLV
jgi:hypothetical protein